MLYASDHFSDDAGFNPGIIEMIEMCNWSQNYKHFTTLDVSNKKIGTATMCFYLKRHVNAT